LLFNEIAQSFATDSSVRFLWIGDGELRQQLSAPNIGITGWLPRDEVMQQLQNLDVYLSTSLWEGMPLSVLLAMCAGKPLVLYDCVGNRDLVEKGRGGFIFTKKEEAVTCIETLKSDTQLVREMGEFSHKRLLDNFHLNAMICHYKMLYEAVGRENSGETG
jgi:glycosyltransferase involved in cell wall biosynthesis